MINIRINGPKGLVNRDQAEKYAWVDVNDATREELDRLEREYKLLPEHIADILDIDEQSRIEKEDDYTLIIIRLPVRDERYDVSYYTVPFGIFLFSDRIVTISHTDCEVLEEIRHGRAKGLDLRNKSAFVLHLFGRAAIVYLRYLKEINRATAVIEGELQRSVRNHELTQLLAFEKSLVYFTTSLKTNEIVLEKLQASKAMRFKEDETELIEDVVTDNKQAIEMASIYSDILSGMMDAFASVISNNQNLQIKRLTTISIVFMPLNIIASVGGMSEFSSFTSSVPWWVSYSLFGLGLVAVGLLTAGILRLSGLVSDKRLKASPRPWRPAAKLIAPAAGGIVVAAQLGRR